MALFDKSGNFNPDNSVYGQTQNTDGSWNGVMRYNEKPVDVIGEIRDVSQAEKDKIDKMMGPKIKANPKRVKPAGQQQWGLLEDKSSSAALNSIKVGGKGEAISDVDKAIAADDARYTNWSNAQKGIAAAGFMVDVMNANNSYEATKGQARLNIMMARNEAADAIYRGRQAQLDAESEGYDAGQSSQLALAAQGQNLDGAGAQKVQGSYEAMGYEAGAREMLNAYREALGYDLEEINYEYQVDQAGINRDNAILGSALNTAVTMGMM